jgi:antitoxin MazE
MASRISRWGNSLGVRIPREALEKAHLREGDRISIEATQQGLLLRAVDRPGLEELVSAISPQNVYAETQTGRAVGNETW